ncbi:MAG: DUF192 domain-containing protein [Elusimicrobiota bacterium]|jgi:uncharacterized membrane protein (UPF0127 family)|nr:DUF192 domain-containing protein [Elusimicrobiota bacterium]
MMKVLSHYFFATIIVILFCSFSFADSANLPTAKVQVGGNVFSLLVAKTSAQQQKGLGGYKTIPQDGMIFIFARPQTLVFYMKDMLFPIDIIWIANNKVVGFSLNVPVEKNVAVKDLKLYYSPALCDTVIELAAGSVKKLNIKAGDIVKTGL